MKIDNRTKCCSTCNYWWGLGTNYLVGEVEVEKPMLKCRCRCKYNKEGKRYYDTPPLYKCNFYEQSERLMWYDGDNWLSRKRRNK